MSLSAIVNVVDVLAIVCGFLLLRHTLDARKKPTAPLPPGPPGYPIIGNLLDMPTDKEWLTFTKWSNTYGDLASVNVFGQRIVLVSSARTAVEMLDKKGSIYSDRPSIPMGGELVGWKNTLILLAYGSRFRKFRRMAHQLFGNNATMGNFHPMEELETKRFLKRVLAKPDALEEHIRKTAGAIILRISHGYEIREDHDPFVMLADKATSQFSLSTAPGGFLVNHLPFLRHVPEWIPGGGFRGTAREWANILASMVDLPHNLVKQQMATGKAPLSFTSSQLEGREVTPEEEFDIKWLAASLYSGGADTTVSSIYAFFKAMIMFPDVQAKAQAELDLVVGPDRLPSFKDRCDLPYIEALVLEVMRWHSVVPIVIPHLASEDDIHDGYFIPKGTLVLANNWKMLHDQRIYENPFEFQPERFLKDPPAPDPRNVAFGFGRRICPGRVLADASVFISCAMVLAVFRMAKCTQDGVPVEPDMEQSTGTISHPSPFKCVITPRSEKAVALIQK